MTVFPQQFWSGGVKGSLLTQAVRVGVSLPADGSGVLWGDPAGNHAP